MFELSVAGKYLTPKWRQLSVSIISLISILVIALVVWLIVVFFSVTNGLEKSWIEKLVALTAPVRITPTEDYYNSYYYLADSISATSDYTLKSIGEKYSASTPDPYDPQVDEELPITWPKPDLNKDGQLKDLVKLAYEAIDSLNGDVQAKDFEMTGGHLNLQLVRHRTVDVVSPVNQPNAFTTATLSQAAYLSSFDPSNQLLTKAILPLTARDAVNILTLLEVAGSPSYEVSDHPESIPAVDLQSYLAEFFKAVDIKELTTPPATWNLPRHLLPENGVLSAWALYKNDKLVRVVIPQEAHTRPNSVQNGTDDGYQAEAVQIKIQDKEISLLAKGKEAISLPKYIPIALAENIPLSAQLDTDSLRTVKKPSNIVLNLQTRIQGHPLAGKAPLKNLVISRLELSPPSTADIHNPFLWNFTQRQNNTSSHILPSNTYFGEGILLPRSFRDVGVAIGDQGSVSYAAPTTSSVQEQRIPIFVAGFYEPGVIPTGGKIILVNPEVTSIIRSSISQNDTAMTNGINVRFDNLNQAEIIKHKLQAALADRGIANYWNVETYRDYEFTKDLIKQLQSEKNLFTLLATIIILVACSNIISMLIILVNDKKMEIGILRSMGATSFSIAFIFGTCGVFMGVAGSLMGTLAAIATLKNLPLLVNTISRIQGHDMFNPVYFGENLPTELSLEALLFVIVATTVISLLAGLVPAIKASLVRPSTILRSE